MTKTELSNQIANAVMYFAEKPKRRNKKERGVCMENLCFYSGKTTGKQTKGCIAGYFLKPQQRINIDTRFTDGIDIESLVDLYDFDLPKIITDNVKLFSYLQGLHDNKTNWEKVGLSKEGKEYLLLIINKFKLVKKPFLCLLK